MPKRLSAPNEIHISTSEPDDTSMLWVDTDAEGVAGGGGGITSIVAGTNITIDDTDPDNPIISASGGGSVAIAMGRGPGESSGHVGAPQQWFATLYTATNTQDITYLQAFCNVVSGSNTVQLGIYSEAGTLLSSGTATVTTTGKFTVTLAAPVAVTKANNYWLALCNQTNTSGTNFAYFTSNGNSTLVNRYSGGASLAGTLPAGSTTATAFCIMAY